VLLAVAVAVDEEVGVGTADLLTESSKRIEFSRADAGPCTACYRIGCFGELNVLF
jgi:hypothetical protein